jgi:hypothetical protein
VALFACALMALVFFRRRRQSSTAGARLATLPAVIGE